MSYALFEGAIHCRSRQRTRRIQLIILQVVARDEFQEMAAVSATNRSIGETALALVRPSGSTDSNVFGTSRRVRAKGRPDDSLAASSSTWFEDLHQDSACGVINRRTPARSSRHSVAPRPRACGAFAEERRLEGATIRKAALSG
jgi:hypothetical protein